MGILVGELMMALKQLESSDSVLLVHEDLLGDSSFAVGSISSSGLQELN
jgi:hypothetical protein